MNILIAYHSEQDAALHNIEEFLKKKKINFNSVNRERLAEKDYAFKDLVIVVGDDGSFLRASHLNRDIPMAGINANPGRREGFFMQMDTNNFTKKLEPILKGKFRVFPLLRLETMINGKRLGQLALNDIYVGDAKPYALFNYDLKIRDKMEFHRGSGIIIGTPAGSTAWTASAGGKKMKMDENKFQYVARELYYGKLTNKYKLKRGILNKTEHIEIITKNKGIVVIDSISKEYRLNAGDKIRVYVSDNYLKYISFD